jgi:tRNA pseudouridine55 synthase
VLEVRDASRLDETRVRSASRAFVGDLEQMPPMVSALKVGGRRLHELARRGVEVERTSRKIHVAQWEWLEFAWPEARFRVVCSGGTYVRTLAHDLGVALECGAALAALRRTRSEPFGLERAATMRDLDERPATEVIARSGMPLDEALEVLPSVTLDLEAEAAIGTGRRPAIEPGDAPIGTGPRSVVFRDRAGRALALGELMPDPGRPGRVLAGPHAVFPWAVRTGPGAAARVDRLEHARAAEPDAR